MLMLRAPLRLRDSIVSMPSMPRQRVLEDLRDARLDHRRGGAGVVHVDRDDRRVDRRQFAQRQARERHHAEHDQQQAHARSRRPGGGSRGRRGSCASPPASPRRGRGCGGRAVRDDASRPARSLTVPSMTMRSPAARPSAISTSPGGATPSSTVDLLDRLPSALTRYTNASRADLHDRDLRAPRSACRCAREQRRPCISMPGRSSAVGVRDLARAR